ncbi:uncharacterized protein LOC127259081 [Andrographis paniculata]|uniref:uncharacterized protein LOC127259081 n=1 Tax=Andrographis paniculata TaxID=175694 RepID=UPI0021E838F3|nr:uncharacterized protein LOC127259081 [Andrographis paniculata]
MKDFPSCFGENGVQVADSSSSSSSSSANKSAPQNLVTCVYQYDSRTFSGFITVTWIKYLMGQGLSIAVESPANECLCKADMKPWLFSKRKGFKRFVVNSATVDIYWDLSSAKFGSSPEPLEGFYLAVAFDQELCLLLGDSQHKAYRKIDSKPPISTATFVAKREHVFGKRLYNSRAQFHDKGELHDLRIEHDHSKKFDNSLVMYIDKKKVLQVTHLKWKFRGNQNISVDGISIEVYWDVHSWLFGTIHDKAIFLFRTRFPGEKLATLPSPHSCPAILRTKDTESQAYGFSLVLCAWRNE